MERKVTQKEIRRATNMIGLKVHNVSRWHTRITSDLLCLKNELRDLLYQQKAKPQPITRRVKNVIVAIVLDIYELERQEGRVLVKLMYLNGEVNRLQKQCAHPNHIKVPIPPGPDTYREECGDCEKEFWEKCKKCKKLTKYRQGF